MQKRIITICTILGGVLGSYVPALWGAPSFSMSAILLGGVGSIIGIWIGFTISR